MDKEIIGLYIKPLFQIGHGKFGKIIVSLAKTNNKSSLITIKCIQKCNNNLDIIQNEINFFNKMTQIKKKCHFLINHIYQQHSESYFYLLSDFAIGGDFIQLMNRFGNSFKTHSNLEFYSWCILNALDYLHENDIIYKDLKLDNTVLDCDGYPKLCDFGMASTTTESQTKGGTFAYMGPEYFLHRCEITSKSDIWAFGIFIYCFITSIYPFGTEKDTMVHEIKKRIDQTSTYQNTILKPIRELLRKIFKIDPTTTPSAKELLCNNYFKQMNNHAEDILSHKYKVPFKAHMVIKKTNDDEMIINLLIKNNFKPERIEQDDDLFKDLKKTFEICT